LSNNAVVEFFGGTPQQTPDHYREGSPYELKVSARQIVIHGANDDVVPPDFSSRYASEKKRRGEAVDFVEIKDGGHFELIDPRTASFKVALACVNQLFQ
jgi:dipeptidyl aminopeptidase/acylaminoacyl peptidase